MLYQHASALPEQFVDTNGVPLSGGVLSAYVAGTSTPTEIYTDAAGTSAGSSVTLNSSGYPEVSGNTILLWLDQEVTYKFVLRDADGVSIWTVDNVVGSPGGFTLTVADIAALRLIAGPLVKYVTVSGYYAAGDGGGGRFHWDAASAAADDGGMVVTPTGQAGAGRWLREASTPVSFKWFGAVDDDATSNIAFMRNAVDYLLANGGGELYIPAGVYWFAGGDSISLGAGNITFVGDGRDASVLHSYEGVTFPAQTGDDFLFKDITQTAKGSLTFRNLQFRGTLDAGSRAGRWANPLWLDHYESILIDDCKFYNIAAEAMDFHFCKSFTCVNSWFENISADAIRGRDCGNVFCDNNYIQRNGDDAIAFASSNNNEATGLRIRESTIITNNILNNTGSIKVQGGRIVTISSNIMQLSLQTQIWLSCDPAETTVGQNDQYSISIQDNLLCDNIAMDADGVTTGTVPPGITLAFKEARGGTATNNVIPSFYDSVSGSFIYPTDNSQTYTGVATNAVSPGRGISVQNNIIQRTLAAGNLFSSYGFGDALRQGVGYDPTVTGTMLLRSFALTMRGSVTNCHIGGNLIANAEDGVNIAADDIDLSLTNVVVENNDFFEILNRGVIISSGAATYQDVTIRDNSFDMDRYRLSALSNIDGSYSADGLPYGVSTASLTGIKIISNSFKNTNRIFQSNNRDDLIIRDNVVIGEPAATGFSTSNKGIGTVERAGPGFNWIVVNSDPTDAGYGQYITAQTGDLTAVPATGTWVHGTFIAVRNPVESGGKVLRGWMRITTGSANVINVDWQPQYVSIT